MHKGKEFTPADLTARAIGKLQTKEAIVKHVATLTERFRIVAYDRNERKDRQPIIAEELTQRVVNKISDVKVKRMVGALMALKTQEQRQAVLAAFDSDGSLKNPFEQV